VAFPSVILLLEQATLFLTLYAVILSFLPTETIFINDRTQVIYQTYDFVLHFGDKEILCSLHLVVSRF
jgi:hypothetical protein